MRKTGRSIQQAFYRRDPLSPPFHVNLALGLRFLQASLLLPLHRKAHVGTRALPIRFQAVSRVKRPGKKASQEELKQYKAAVKLENLSPSFVQMGKQLREALDLAGGLDKILVAVTDVGLCSISFGMLESELEDDLATRFSCANISRDQSSLGSLVQQVLSHLTEHSVALDLPLDVRATAFQKRVWKALQQIPRGETRSYGEIARSLGQPSATRAVARACCQNPVAVVIPCHRVVGKSGRLTGYRWGLQRKQKLLGMEHK